MNENLQFYSLIKEGNSQNKSSKLQNKKNENTQFGKKGLKDGIENNLALFDLQKCEIQITSEDPEKEDKIEMEMIPIVRHLKMQTVYMLAGDVMVDLDFGMKEDEHPICQISAINSFKNPIRVEVLKDMANEVDLTISQDSLKEFGKIINILENYPDQYAHDFGVVLRQYQIFVSGQLKKAEFLKDSQEFKSLIPTFDSQFEEFLIDSRQFLKENINKNKFQFYMIIKSNMKTLTHDIARFGLSEGLCQLLGGTGDQIGSLILRRGLFEFFSKETRNNFYFYYLSQLLNVQNVSIERSISLVTLDGIELKVDYDMQNYFGKNPEPNVLFFYPFMLVMITFHIKPYMVKQVLDIRSSLDNETQQFMREFEEDVYYSLESQIFLENHYAEYYQKIVQNNGQGVPKEKRKYKKHPHTIHQLDFRQQNQSVIKQQKQNNKQKEQSNQTLQTNTNSASNQNLNQTSSQNVGDQIEDKKAQSISLTQMEEVQDIDNQNIYQTSFDSQLEKGQSQQIQQHTSQKSYNGNNNHFNQYPYTSQNYVNYENLSVQNFNNKHLNNQIENIMRNKQKIQIQENICVYQISMNANSENKQEVQNDLIMNDDEQSYKDLSHMQNNHQINNLFKNHQNLFSSDLHNFDNNISDFNNNEQSITQ